jgi:hypothetical protein
MMILINIRPNEGTGKTDIAALKNKKKIYRNREKSKNI